MTERPERSKSTRRRVAGFLLRAAISAAIIALLLAHGDIDFQRIAHRMGHADLYLVALCLGGIPLLLFVKTVRWYVLMQGAGIQFGLWASFRCYMAAFAVGVVTPGRLGELLRAFCVTLATGTQTGTALRTVVSDRLYDLVALGCCGAVGLASIVLDLPGRFWLPGLLLLAASAFSAIHVVGKMAQSAYVRRFVPAPVRNLVSSVAGDFAVSRALPNALVTVLAYLIYFGIGWMLLRALAIPFPFLQTCVVMSALSLVLLLPISVAGFGTREVSLIYLFSSYGIATEGALSFAMAQFLVFFVFGGMLGAAFLVATPIRLGPARYSSALPDTDAPLAAPTQRSA